MEQSRKQVEKDLPRTDAGNLAPQEEEQLRRLLLAFVFKFPTIGCATHTTQQARTWLSLGTVTQEMLI
jgi:hypothetical protein